MIALANISRASSLKKNCKSNEHERKLTLNKHHAASWFRNFLFRSFIFRNSTLLRISIFWIIFALAPSLAHAIDAPRDTRGTVVKPTQIKWEWAESAGAVRYQVDVNGSFVAYVKGTAYRSTDLSDGDYWFTVQAVNNDNVHSSPSQRSPTVTIGADNSNASRNNELDQSSNCLLYTSPSPRDKRQSRMPSSA